MSNVIQLHARSPGGFTRMDNNLYEALIGADLSGRELRVAMAIHRLTSGYNKDSVKVAALYISKMMYGDTEKAQAERANISRAINSLIRQRVIFRDGGSRDPIEFLPVPEWKIDPNMSVLKTTHCVEKAPATVLKTTHIKERNTNTTANAVVDAVASTDEDLESEAEQQGTTTPDQPEAVKVDRVPYAKIVALYNQVCGGKFRGCLTLSDKRKTNIRKLWNLKINGELPFRKSEFWEGFFNDCLLDKHWLGENDRGWKASLEFVTREENALRVLEGE
jgi:phage replication O-like protein O